MALGAIVRRRDGAAAELFQKRLEIEVCTHLRLLSAGGAHRPRRADLLSAKYKLIIRC